MLIGAVVLLAAPLAAQSPDTTSPQSFRLIPLMTPGSVADDRLRVTHLTGDTEAAGYLIRSPSTLAAPLAGNPGGLRWAVIAPELRTVWNSKIPYTLNDGAMWAGRGFTVRLMAGIRAEYGPVSLILAPQLIRTRNRDFRTIPSSAPGFSSLAPPWYTGSISADLPYRPGTVAFTLFDLGQSTLSVAGGPITIGASTENQWWGPGIRNALVLSNHAAGIPHLFLRTASPARTRIGDFEAKWLVGGLTESLYFDADPTNDIRSISALALTYRPVWEPGLTVGLARSVYGAVDGGGSVPGRYFDVLTRWGGPDSTAADPGTEVEQLLSLFGRWVLPDGGVEAYFEWARVELPASFRDLLTAPHYTQGYTVGLQWAGPVGAAEAHHVRVQAELTYLEQSSTFRVRPTPLFYVSRFVPQGYTHRGQSLGAAIGPGASSQWVATDYLASNWRAGIFAGRIRWDNDAYYRQPTGRSEVAHDVSVLGGIRGAVDVGRFRLAAEVTRTQRYNFLYQNLLQGFTGAGAVDPTNTALSFTVTPLR